MKVEGSQRAEHGHWDIALSLWNRALALTPEDGILHELRSQALYELEEAWDAVQAATRAAELLPRSADVLVTLARAQLNLGEVCRTHMRAHGIVSQTISWPTTCLSAIILTVCVCYVNHTVYLNFTPIYLSMQPRLALLSIEKALQLQVMPIC